MTQLIQRLERRELVARLADPGDRRVALVTITDARHRLVVERQEHVRERVGELMAMLPPTRCGNRPATPVHRRLVAG
jgi:DNA-binding MarR family transcriptional regulator